MGILIDRTNAEDSRILDLVRLLDTELSEYDGDQHAFYDQFNQLHTIQYVVLLSGDDRPISCGALRLYDDFSMEIKRMYTLQDERRKGYAKRVLQELENWTSEMGYTRCLLETGSKQKEAVALYQNLGYKQIANYGPYKNVSNSICFEKKFLNGLR
ncbi:MAG: GNAT family N-acetyltransferase [Bacteroidetes bacterium]|nr:GNAT family N-acetyltransferase [Bacteroidota bacterium]